MLNGLLRFDYLTELSEHLPAPYWEQPRGTDEYGYASVQGNYYWVPGSTREDVKILLYADRVKIYRQQTCLVEYPLPADGVKNVRFSPPGQPAPRHLPKHRKHGSQHEELRLRALGPEVGDYLDYALQTPGIQRHRFLRELLTLSRQVAQPVFVQTLQRALRYRVHAEFVQFTDLDQFIGDLTNISPGIVPETRCPDEWFQPNTQFPSGDDCTAADFSANGGRNSPGGGGLIVWRDRPMVGIDAEAT